MKKLTLKNIQNLFELKEWIKETTGYFNGKDISKDSLSVTVSFLQGKVRDSQLSNKILWLNQLEKLNKALEGIDE